MVLRGVFKLGGEVQEVIIDGNTLMFYENGTVTSIEGLRLNKSGIVKEFPDLEDDEDWRKKSIERLKEHMRKMETEKQKMNYVRDELVKFGYVPLFTQRAGFRPSKFVEEK